ncbi:MAG: diguanylate cyclase response regulator [Phycisphaerae bacterium]|nr:MAG: diguanylate cyclase response regulator [Phycisphaerae bacterium]
MQPLKLLMIEDDADQRELVREIIEDHFGKNTVICAGSRTEALRHRLSDFDLILMDFNLPDATGMELLTEITSHCNKPVIMVTGENSGEMAAEAIRKGATDYVVKVGDYMFTIPLVIEKNLTVAKLRLENEVLRENLEKALAEVQATNQQLEDSLKRMEQMAATDPLTGLYNRRHYSKVLEQLFAESQRYGHDLSAVMIDLDGYKQLNDTFGHAFGDQLLVLGSKIIQSNLRRGDVAARYGGDEFVLLLPHASAAEAERVVERIRQEFKTVTAQMLKRPLGVSMSIGIASLSTCRSASADELMASADTALYKAKEAGRDRVSCAQQGARLMKVPA